jgi:uncharacterized protein
MGLLFRWDPVKARSNLRRHRISFERAAEIFGDPLLLTVPDVRHSRDEPRLFSIGRTADNALLVVSHTESSDMIRIISARKATPRERKTYEQGEDL